MRRNKLLVVSLLAAALAACGAGEKLSEASISDDLADRGTTELLDEAANDSYEGPEDGRITEDQLAMYLKVREHEKKIADVARKELEAKGKKLEGNEKPTLAGMADAFSAFGSIADIATADIRAAKDLGYNSAEYQWVKERIMAAAGWDMQRKTAASVQTMMDQGYDQLKKQYDEATEPNAKQALGELLASMEQQKKEAAAQPAQDPEAAANEHNLALIQKKADPASVFAYELSKWSGQTTQDATTEVNKLTLQDQSAQPANGQ